MSRTGDAVDLGPRVRRDKIGPTEDAAVLRRSVAAETWVDPDDLDANRRAPRIITASRRADPLRVMAKRGGAINDRHIKAAERLVDLFEVGILGASENRGEKLSVPTGFGAGNYPPERRLDAIASLRRCFIVMGAIGSAVVSFVVLGHDSQGRCDVAAWAARVRVDPKTARGYLIVALDALADHLWPPERSIIDDMIDRAIARGEG